MKLIKIIGHPVTVMVVYLLLLVSGESFGGFYALYILLGLSHGVVDSVVSMLGLLIMLLGYKTYRQRFHPVKPGLYLLADAVLIFGLVLFFRTTKGYNDATFEQTVPLTTFVLFGICVLCNILLSVLLLTQNGKSSRHSMHSVQGHG
jgi:hypothetical protein